MIVKRCLPERSTGARTTRVTRTLLESFHESNQITPIRFALRQEMHMLRHHAVRMNVKSVCVRRYAKAFDNRLGRLNMPKNLSSLATARSDKISPSTKIRSQLQPVPLAPCLHVCVPNIASSARFRPWRPEGLRYTTRSNPFTFALPNVFAFAESFVAEAFRPPSLISQL